MRGASADIHSPANEQACCGGPSSWKPSEQEYVQASPAAAPVAVHSGGFIPPFLGAVSAGQVSSGGDKTEEKTRLLENVINNPMINYGGGGGG